MALEATWVFNKVIKKEWVFAQSDGLYMKRSIPQGAMIYIRLKFDSL